jgi:hypothetical protein
MKKIIALILATIMVMFAVAACGGTEPAGTTAKPNTPDNSTTASTTEATTTTEQIIIPDPYTALAYLPTGDDAQAVNVVTGDVIGKLTAGTGIELKGGYFYVVDVVPAEGKQTATKEVGAAISTQKIQPGWTNVLAKGDVLDKTGSYLKGSSYFLRAVALKNFTLNAYMDVATLTAALEGTNIGEFGTLTVVKAENGDILLNSSIDGELFASELNVKFVYVGYDGADYGVATGTTYSPAGFNHVEILNYAMSKAWGEDGTYLRTLWQNVISNYKAPESVVTVDGKYNGALIQNHHQNTWQNALIPVKYTSAKTNYEGLITGDVTEAKVAADLAAANTALAAAQKAFDDAVAANASVKALKDALDAATTALEAAKQAAYEAKATHETEKAKDKNSQATADAQAVRTEKEAAQTTAQTAYDAAKAAFDGAVASDATLTALNTALTEATTAQKTAQGAQTKVDEYKKWSDLYAKFITEYNKVANVALWDAENMTESVLYKWSVAPEAAEGETAEEPIKASFTYFYDTASETYVIFVTSLTNNTVIKTWDGIAAKTVIK